MKHIMILAFIVFISAIVAIAFLMGSRLTAPTGFAVAESEDENISEIPSFRLYTKAVCENVSNFIICHDELFASCGGFEYRLPENEVNGNGIFDKYWKDPRKNS